jgi:catechol 2,3-dioxygenase-like lactoylglutathione lyase family enzyme
MAGFPPRLVPELSVDDIDASLAFWCGVLGFAVKYERPEEGFAYLTLSGAELMLDQRDGGPVERHGIWETGPMQRPYGRGINLEIQVDDVDAVLERVRAASIPIRFGPEERWYRTGATELGVRRFLVQDPDGYLVRLQQEIGIRLVLD